jgi:hypothetical protein
LPALPAPVDQETKRLMFRKKPKGQRPKQEARVSGPSVAEAEVVPVVVEVEVAVPRSRPAFW